MMSIVTHKETQQQSCCAAGSGQRFNGFFTNPIVRMVNTGNLQQMLLNNLAAQNMYSQPDLLNVPGNENEPIYLDVEYSASSADGFAYAKVLLDNFQNNLPSVTNDGTPIIYRAIPIAQDRIQIRVSQRLYVYPN